MSLGSIDYQIDRAGQRVVIYFIGDVDGDELRSSMDRLWTDFADIATCDSICDMREFTGDIGYDDIRCIAQSWKRFCAGADRGRRTAVVSHDRFAPLLVQAIAFCFNRQLAAFRSMDEAHAWLDQPD